MSKLSLTFKENTGSPVFIPPEPMPTRHDWDDFRWNHDNRLTKQENMQEGMDLLVPCIFGWAKAKVVADFDGEFHAETEDNLYMLDFDKDDRHCWVCSMQIRRPLGYGD